MKESIILQCQFTMKMKFSHLTIAKKHLKLLPFLLHSNPTNYILIAYSWAPNEMSIIIPKKEKKVPQEKKQQILTELSSFGIHHGFSFHRTILCMSWRIPLFFFSSFFVFIMFKNTCDQATINMWHYVHTTNSITKYINMEKERHTKNRKKKKVWKRNGNEIINNNWIYICLCVCILECGTAVTIKKRVEHHTKIKMKEKSMALREGMNECVSSCFVNTK